MSVTTFNERIEARRRVRSHAPREIAKDERGTVVAAALVALGKSAQPYFKNPRKGVDEVMCIS